MTSCIKSLNVNDVLEIGPGNGPLITCIENLSPEKKILIDFPGTLGGLKIKGYRCIEQDLSKEQWEISDESVDLVVASMVLEHMAETDFVMREIFRVLRPNGHVLINVPNQGALIYIIMLFLTLNPPMNMVSNDYYGLGNPLSKSRFKKSIESNSMGYGHLRLFATRAMNDLLRIHGFKIVFNHGGSWGIPFLGKFLAGIFPYWGLCTIVLARKQNGV
jgi:ubiquinone/menaquinone biosynthesis C-methylase UbiE